MEARPGGLTLELQHVLPAPRAIVFGALTDPDQLSRWWGPKGFTIPSLDFVARPGRRYVIEMQPPEGDAFHLRGEFREVDPPARLAYTFVWDPPDPDDVETLVTLSLRDLSDSTELVLEQGKFKTEERQALHSDGWSESLDRLEALLGGAAA